MKRRERDLIRGRAHALNLNLLLDDVEGGSQPGHRA